jgi:hypothetical protein
MELEVRARDWQEVNRRGLLGVSRADDVIRLRYKALPELRAPLQELVAGENECCNVGGVRFDFEDTDEEFVLIVSAPDAARGHTSAQTILAAFERMGS